MAYLELRNALRRAPTEMNSKFTIDLAKAAAYVRLLDFTDLILLFSC